MNCLNASIQHDNSIVVWLFKKVRNIRESEWFEFTHVTYLAGHKKNRYKFVTAWGY